MYLFFFNVCFFNQAYPINRIEDFNKIRTTFAHQKGGFKRYHMNARKMKNPANQ